MKKFELKKVDGSIIAIEGKSLQDAMEHAISRGISLDNVDISNVTFKDAEFVGAKLAGSHFSNVRFENMDCTGANLSRVSFTNCTFIEVDTMEMDISDSSFEQCKFERTAFVYVKGYDPEKFVGCSYKDCV